MHAVAFSAGERAHLLLLVRALEIELCDIAAGIDGPLAQFDRVVAA